MICSTSKLWYVYNWYICTSPPVEDYGTTFPYVEIWCSIANMNTYIKIRAICCTYNRTSKYNEAYRPMVLCKKNFLRFPLVCLKFSEAENICTFSTLLMYI